MYMFILPIPHPLLFLLFSLSLSLFSFFLTSTRPHSITSPHTHDADYESSLESTEHHNYVHRCYNLLTNRFREVTEAERGE